VERGKILNLCLELEPSASSGAPPRDWGSVSDYRNLADGRSCLRRRSTAGAAGTGTTVFPAFDDGLQLVRLGQIRRSVLPFDDGQRLVRQGPRRRSSLLFDGGLQLVLQGRIRGPSRFRRRNSLATESVVLALQKSLEPDDAGSNPDHRGSTPTIHAGIIACCARRRRFDS